MARKRTALGLHLTEHRKARARLPLFTLIALICPPLAGVRSTAVWIFYGVFIVAYALWSLRLVRTFAADRRLGYLLSLTDIAILLPLLAWTSSAALQTVLAAVCACGFMATYAADRRAKRTAGGLRNSDLLQPAMHVDDPGRRGTETALERALRVRLWVLESTQTKFALVMLRMLRFEDMTLHYGEEASDHLLSAVIRRGLRLMGADAQHFVLPGGRVAFVFSTGAGSTRTGASNEGGGEWIDPYDVESFAMALGRRACEHLIDGHRVECVVGWASAPADGVNAEDLVYTAESGAESAAAFRRVAGSRIIVPEKTRAAAG
ncbi:MAG: hypothetical protein A2133_11270 [Actinobacteria bacterium RBG_16_64_13]|nr:MAG: hypothetical protein A2133_11270 [Actinobacteria bacterium RBG_16_64_13]